MGELNPLHIVLCDYLKEDDYDGTVTLELSCNE